jgi:hypothetical protein
VIHRRAASAPSVHHAPKNVHFPSSAEGGLTTVRMFNRSARPRSLSLGSRFAAGEETETETEGTEGEGWSNGGPATGWGTLGGFGGWGYTGGGGRAKAYPAPVVRGGGGAGEKDVDGLDEVNIQVDDEASSHIPRLGAQHGDANVYFESLGFVRDGQSFPCFFLWNVK